MVFVSLHATPQREALADLAARWKEVRRLSMRAQTQ